MQGQPLLDDDLSWMDSLIGGEILLTDENVAPGMPMPDAPETGLGTGKTAFATHIHNQLRHIAESVVKECAGLPLGIMTMAGSMKGVLHDNDNDNEQYHWRDALRQLRISEVRPSDMETEVFRVLKFSYAQLKDPALQKCFLHITLFPKGKIIRREDLIEYLIDEGIVEEMEEA
uniref:Uncharacterized protein n=1 Tax=Salix viminalis TaxID=40686 RepID=A0A6N2MK32_SALVM